MTCRPCGEVVKATRQGKGREAPAGESTLPRQQELGELKAFHLLHPTLYPLACRPADERACDEEQRRCTAPICRA